MTRFPTLLRGVLLPSRLLGSATAHRPAPAVLTRSAIGHPGRAANVPTLVIAVFDNSGSVVSPSGSDPLANRFAEVDAAFSLVARRGSRQELGAVLHFDTPTSGDVMPLPLLRRNLTRLRAGLRIPDDGAGSSVLGPSLHRAEALADTHSDHAVTLVVLSDFLLMDANPAQVLAELAAFPGHAHAVVLGHTIRAEVFDSRITVTPVSQDAPPGAVARALFRSITAHRPGSYVRPEPYP